MKTSHRPGELGSTRPSIGDDKGRIEFSARPAGAAFYVDTEGTRWRIFDCVARRGGLERVYLESEHATHRVFQAGAGRQQVYRRARRESFLLSPESCERQLRMAAVVRRWLELEPH